jgi:hypothetical protein
MLRRSQVVRDVAGVVALCMLAVLYSPPLQAQAPPEEPEKQTETQKVAECVETAWDEYLECIDDLPWWLEALCVFRFSADFILCMPKIVLRGA